MSTECELKLTKIRDVTLQEKEEQLEEVRDTKYLMDVPCSECKVIVMTFVGDVPHEYNDILSTCPLCGKVIYVDELPEEVYALKDTDGKNWTHHSAEKATL